MKEYAELITINPEIQFGKPYIKSIRIAASDILQWLACGMSYQQITGDYPAIHKEQIRAVLAFTAV